MLPILFVTTVYPPPGEDESDYCPDGESDSDTLPMGFRELVQAIRHGGYVHPSTSHRTVRNITERDWLSTESEQDMYSGEYTQQSVHLDSSATPHQVRYWRLAWKAAGIVKA